MVRFGAGGFSVRPSLLPGRSGRQLRIARADGPGNELAGEVVEIGQGVTKVRLRQRIAVNPSRPCLHCRHCLSGRSNLCRNIRFNGSAARFPHVQGGFADLFIASENQCVPIPDSLSYVAAACAEPLAVTLHAVSRAGHC